jgi:CPA2 family monovalent cation:H+ antiporter-2
MHDSTLISTLAVGLSAALIGGIIAAKLRLPPLVGYLLAGLAVGPNTPGFVADSHIAPQLAEVGVILLMFGVGIHFAPRDLLAVRRIALPGAIGQVAVATLLGIGLAQWWNWTLGEGIVFGLALSVASTVVLLRALESRSAVDSEDGRVAVGWLVVEDLVTVLALVMLPALATVLGGTPLSESSRSLPMELAVTLAKVTLFAVLMLVAGVRIIPAVLAWVERTGSRELFVLSTLAIALGIAYAAYEFFGVSLALGAFLAGVVVNESELSHRAAEEALPLREAFAVLFFVSVGMLIDPGFLVDHFDRVALVALVIIVGKAVAALGIVRALGGNLSTGLMVAAGLAQIGEFSFILADLGIGLDLLPQEGRDLILAGALVSIALNPLVWRLIDLIVHRRGVELEGAPAKA